MTLKEKIHELKGPILILGAGGFVGANLYRMLQAEREDVWGTVTDEHAWRLADVHPKNMFVGRFDRERDMSAPVSDFKTVFNCLAYGGYPRQTNTDLIYWTNFELTRTIVQDLMRGEVAAYVHAGSSSEYGENASAPTEEGFLAVNSDYAVSKAAAAAYLYYVGQKHEFPCANLRLYSVYGPWEDENRLIPAVIRHGMRGSLPPFVRPDISRDFVYVDDACEAFVDAAINIYPPYYGHSFNVGTGVKTTIAEVAAVAIQQFGLEARPMYEMESRSWDVADWVAAPDKASSVLGWQARTDFETGMRKTLDWERGRHGKP